MRTNGGLPSLCKDSGEVAVRSTPPLAWPVQSWGRTALSRNGGKVHIQTYLFQIYFNVLNWGSSWSVNKLMAVIWQQEYQICVWSQAIHFSISHFSSVASVTRHAVWDLHYFVSQRKLKLDRLMHSSFSVFSVRALNWLMPSRYVDSFSMYLLIKIHL